MNVYQEKVEGKSTITMHSAVCGICHSRACSQPNLTYSYVTLKKKIYMIVNGCNPPLPPPPSILELF